MTVLDNLANLQTFVHAADTRSFVETGRLQGISASTKLRVSAACTKVCRLARLSRTDMGVRAMKAAG